MEINWEKYESYPPTSHKNFDIKNIKPNNFAYCEEDIAEFNKIYQFCLEEEKAGRMGRFVVTKGLTISRSLNDFIGVRFAVMHTTTTVTLILKHPETYRFYLFRMGKKRKEAKETSGRLAFYTYKKVLAQHGVDLETLAIDNGFEVKQTIPSPKIELVDAIPSETYYNCHHLDINSAFNAGMMKAFPILEPGIRHIYDKRKENPRFKDILNMTQGFMQSVFVNYRFSHISKAGYVFTNNYIDALIAELQATGRKVLATNTDGIWIQGEIFHNRDEGTDIGQWKNDHVNCRLRFKSKGSYEYIENGKYHPVVRGQTTYERIVPREEWDWGSIFIGHEIEYKFSDEKGVVAIVG
jgi:hypothetical protein